MRKIMIGTAAVAIAAMTAGYSLPAEAQGKGNDKQGERAQQGGKAPKGQKGTKQDDRAFGGERGGQMVQAQMHGNDKGQGKSKGNDQAENDSKSGAKAPDRGSDYRRADYGAPAGKSKGEGKGKDKLKPAKTATSRYDDDRRYVRGTDGRDRDREYYRTDTRYRDNDGPFFARYDRDGNPGLINGCPPGLAKKRNGCLPPGKAKNRDYDPRWFGYSDNDYRYRDGYVVRYGGNGISSYIPLLGGALSIGREWPSNFGVAQVPDYYRSYYNLGDDYRYYDNTLYRLDPGTSVIGSIAALITGDDITVGQPMPRGYDVYNVPVDYRDQYYDRPDAQYRYSDGYVYQVDPTTRLVAAAIQLIV